MGSWGPGVNGGHNRVHNLKKRNWIFPHCPNVSRAVDQDDLWKATLVFAIIEWEIAATLELLVTGHQGHGVRQVMLGDVL